MGIEGTGVGRLLEGFLVMTDFTPAAVAEAVGWWSAEDVGRVRRDRRKRGTAPAAGSATRSGDVLGVLAGCWGPDWGEAYSREEFRAVKQEFGLRPSAPRGGRSVYLSPGRAAFAPEGLPGTYTRIAAGGLVVDLTRGGTAQPSVESIVAVNRELRAAGALEPLPAPFDRDTF